MTEQNLWVIHDPDSKGRVRIVFRLKPYHEHNFATAEEAKAFITGYWAGYHARIKEQQPCTQSSQ